MQEYLTMREIAEKYQINYGTVRSWKLSGKLPPPDRKVGPLYLWRAEVINEWAKTVTYRQVRKVENETRKEDG